jgi:ubiquinone biosynthesis protein UbiJ
VEDILAIILIFGGGTLTALSFSPVGRAVADRLRHGSQPLPPPEVDHEVYDELDRLRSDVSELQERLDFAERLLSKGSTESSNASANGAG